MTLKDPLFKIKSFAGRWVSRGEEKLKKNKFSTIKSFVSGLALVGLSLMSVFAVEDVPRISKEDLKELVGNADVIILDVRKSENWQKSEVKIKGAIRRMPKTFDTWANKLPRDKKLFLY